MRARHATLPGDEIDMQYNPKIHHRYSIRLKGYNYSQEGAYFITICAQQKKCLFGTIKNAKIQLNNLGKVVAEEWRKTLALRDYLKLDAWVVMPNHFHGIIQIEKESSVEKESISSDKNIEKFGKPVSGSIPSIIRSFKSAVTKRFNEVRQTPGGKLWQRNYWEHVIRNETELKHFREYIINNPAHWKLDKLFR